jgi:glycosyltransferase involved in cell wall biosynthesis
MLSIIIPTRQEPYLEKTIQGLLDNATGEIEIIVVLDGDNPPERNPKATYLYFKEPVGMREAINSGVIISKGEYIMKIDAHCIVDKGFDEKLISVHQDNWVQIPRRYTLDVDKWKREDKVVDYEHWIYPLKYHPPSLHGFRSMERQEERKDIIIDDTLTFQGSCYFIKKSYWNELKLLKDEGYGTLPAQEATYIGTIVWTSGGRVVVNKNTWYAHWFKGNRGRGYYMSRDAQRKCYAYSYNYWLNERKEDFIKLIEKFNPPGWPPNFKEKLWTP